MKKVRFTYLGYGQFEPDYNGYIITPIGADYLFAGGLNGSYLRVFSANVNMGASPILISESFECNCLVADIN